MTDPARPRAVVVRCTPEPPPRWHDVTDGLRDRFGAETHLLGPPHLTSPVTTLTALAKNLAQPGNPLLLVVTGTVVRFARRSGDMWALKLPGSIPGRPKSMLRLSSLLETAARATAGRPLLIALDASLPHSPAGRRDISAADLASLLAAASQAHFPWSPDILVRSSIEHRASSIEHRASSIEHRASSIEHRASSIEHRASSIEHRASSIEHRASSIEHRASSIEHALDRVLAASATAADSPAAAAVAECAAVFLRELGDDACALPSQRPSSIRLRSSRPPLPEHVHDDLFALDEGSRLDAALELAGLAEDGNEQAGYELSDLAKRDTSAQVRGYAERLARRSAQPALAMLRWNGLVPRHVYDAARHDLFLPEFIRHPGGPAPIGADGIDPAEAPRHHVELRPFRLTRTPITDRQYLTFLIAEGGPCPDHWATSTDRWERDADRPVVNVSFPDAHRYCAWLDRLLRQRGVLTEAEHIMVPSEVEWESAAGNGSGATHPWGCRPDPGRCNVRATGLGEPAPVGTFSPTGDTALGCVDMVGNVWEWTRSAWGPSYRSPAYGYPYNAGDGRENPDLPGVRRVVRGGAFYYATECANSHTRNRVVAEERHPGGGFRAAVVTR